MLKECIEHIQKTTQPLIHEVEGSTFVINADGEAREILPTMHHPDTIHLNSLDTGDLLLLAILYFLFREGADEELLVALGLLLIL